jgi:hypothetical protein
MDQAIESPIPTRIYTTIDGQAIIEQPQGSVVLFSAQQILTVIRELHVCYDYCAAWKKPNETTS